MKIGEMIQKCLSGSGDISFGRTASAITLAFCLGWDTAYVVFAMRHLNFDKMNIHDVLPAAGALAAQAMFCTIFYGVNKLKAGFENPPATPAPTPTQEVK